MLAYSFLIKSSSKLLVTRTGIRVPTSSISSLWFPWPIYMFFEMRFDLGTLDSGERSLPFGLLVYLYRTPMVDPFSCIIFDFKTLILTIAFALMPENVAVRHNILMSQ